MKTNPSAIIVLSLLLAGICPAGELRPLAERLREFLSWKFGMFIHFNVASFNERQWATGDDAPASFAPTRLDCGQWADAAKAAGMKYAVFTVKHTGGWCLANNSLDFKNTEIHSYEYPLLKAQQGDLFLPKLADMAGGHRAPQCHQQPVE